MSTTTDASVSSYSTSTTYQENFNPNNPYADFYNTQGFASGLERSNGNTVQESDKAYQKGQQDINDSFNSDDPTPVII